MDEIKYFYQSEVVKLLKSIESTKDNNKYWLRDLCIFKIGYICALRASEIGLIKVSNFNCQKGELYCKRLKGSHSNTIRISEIDKNITNQLKKYIKEYRLSEDDYLFLSQHKKPISRQSLDKLIKQYCNAAKLTDPSKWHFHTLKHSIAVHLAETGLDIKDLQYYLGHKNVANTLIYFQYTSVQQKFMYSKIKSSNSIATY